MGEPLWNKNLRDDESSSVLERMRVTLGSNPTTAKIVQILWLWGILGAWDFANAQEPKSIPSAPPAIIKSVSKPTNEEVCAILNWWIGLIKSKYPTFSQDAFNKILVDINNWTVVPATIASLANAFPSESIEKESLVFYASSLNVIPEEVTKLSASISKLPRSVQIKITAKDKQLFQWLLNKALQDGEKKPWVNQGQIIMIKGYINTFFDNLADSLTSWPVEYLDELNIRTTQLSYMGIDVKELQWEIKKRFDKSNLLIGPTVNLLDQENGNFLLTHRNHPLIWRALNRNHPEDPKVLANWLKIRQLKRNITASFGNPKSPAWAVFGKVWANITSDGLTTYLTPAWNQSGRVFKIDPSLIQPLKNENCRIRIHVEWWAKQLKPGLVQWDAKEALDYNLKWSSEDWNWSTINIDDMLKNWWNKGTFGVYIKIDGPTSIRLEVEPIPSAATPNLVNK